MFRTLFLRGLVFSTLALAPLAITRADDDWEDYLEDRREAYEEWREDRDEHYEDWREDHRRYERRQYDGRGRGVYYPRPYYGLGPVHYYRSGHPRVIVQGTRHGRVIVGGRWGGVNVAW